MQIKKQGVTFYRRDKNLKKMVIKDDFIFYIDDSGDILEIVSPLEAIDSKITLEDFFPSTYEEAFLNSLKQAKLYNKLEVFNYELIIAGESKFFEISLIPLSSNILIGILRDITIEKKSMTYLKIIEKICERTSDGVLIFSKDGEYIKYNDALLEILGVQQSELNSLDNYRDFFDKNIFLDINSDKNIYKQKSYIFKNKKEKTPVWISVNTITGDAGSNYYRVAIFTDISEIENSRKKLEYMASYDELTSLPNKRLLIKYLKKTIDKSILKKRVGALFFIDLDDFKIINDTMGHQVGDKLLKEIALRVKSIVKRGDIFGRLGGDEFLLIIRDISRVDYLFKIAQKVVDTINQPFKIGGIKHYIGASIGIALFPYDAREHTKLIKSADMAMYKAKELGKNRYHFYSLEPDYSLKRKVFVEKILRYAIKNDGFFIEFQPQVNVSTNAVIAFESLLRIKSSIARDIPPSEFIKVAEESNLIFDIGKWSIQRSIQQLYLWKQFYDIKKISISINLSKRQLLDENLPFFVDKTLTQFNIEPNWIEFEVTENVILNSNDRVVRNIKRLKDMGCHISIDDFGTGNLSLNTFKDKMVDKIKIDKSFIDDLTTNKDYRDIVKASIAMAKMMGLSIIAEGVEREEQKRVLSILGCNGIQGYFFSKPLRPNAVLPYVILDKSLKRDYFN